MSVIGVESRRLLRRRTQPALEHQHIASLCLVTDLLIAGDVTCPLRLEFLQ